MNAAVVIAIALIAGGVLYIRLRWRRSPRAYRAMFALASCYFVAGAIAGAWIPHLSTLKNNGAPNVAPPTAASIPSPVALVPTPNPSSVRIPDVTRYPPIPKAEATSQPPVIVTVYCLKYTPGQSEVKLPPWYWTGPDHHPDPAPIYTEPVPNCDQARKEGYRCSCGDKPTGRLLE